MEGSKLPVMGGIQTEARQALGLQDLYGLGLDAPKALTGPQSSGGVILSLRECRGSLVYLELLWQLRAGEKV